MSQADRWSQASSADLEPAVFREQLLGWYDAVRRDLPWRDGASPYHTWVSEIMLQQTQVDTAIPYFERFIKAFPTVGELAAADQETVLKLWEGLGYYSRARNLHAAAAVVDEQYGGRLPASPDELRELPGVGEYTAGAIASIAFKQPVPAVDGNVLRVMARLLALEENVSRAAIKRQLRERVRVLVDEQRPGDFNQALMELGALVCRPRAPQCLDCPVQTMCRGYAEGIAEQLPIKNRSRQPKVEERQIWLLQCPGPESSEPQWLIRQREPGGLLAKMWEFPSGDQLKQAGLCDDQQLARAARGSAQLVENGREHRFSHLVWRLQVLKAGFEATGLSPARVATPFRWVSYQQLMELPMPRVMRDIGREHLAGCSESR